MGNLAPTGAELSNEIPLNSSRSARQTAAASSSILAGTRAATRAHVGQQEQRSELGLGGRDENWDLWELLHGSLKEFCDFHESGREVSSAQAASLQTLHFCGVCVSVFVLLGLQRERRGRLLSFTHRRLGKTAGVGTFPAESRKQRLHP